MAVTIGTNAGFVSGTTRPSSDPSGSGSYAYSEANATSDTSPGTGYAVTEVGWWFYNSSTNTNFQVGIYSHDADGDSGAGCPNALLASAADKGSGTSAAWVYNSVSWTCLAGTYWLAAQLDVGDTDGANCYGANAGHRAVSLNAQSSLPASWGGTSSSGLVDNAWAIYALYSAAGGVPIANMMYHYMHH